MECLLPSGQKLVGPQPKLDASAGWGSAYVPLAVKVVRDNAEGQRERDNLEKMKKAMQQTPGPWHIALYEDAFPFFDEGSQQHNLYIATRCG